MRMSARWISYSRGFRVVAIAVLLVGMTWSAGVASAQGVPDHLRPVLKPGQNPLDEVPVLISFTHLPGPHQAAIVRAGGGDVKYVYHLVPAIAASIPIAAVGVLEGLPGVARIELDGQIYPIDTELDDSWGVKRIGAGIVHDGGNKGAGVKVAILDTGIDYTHPDLDDNYAGGRDFADSDEDPMDPRGHGTHVAGIVAAEDNELGVVGVAPEASLYAAKIFRDDSEGGNWSDAIAALEWCVDNQIDVTNNSYGSDVDPGGTVKAAFDNAAAEGVLHVAGAGNDYNEEYPDADTVIYPAKYESVIAVGATDSSDNRASFSSTGPTVELAAPGVQILSTIIHPGRGPLWKKYGYKRGTSMASPHVAGTAALAIAAGITDANGNGRINDEVRQRLQQTADDLGDPGRDTWYGFGLVDADEAAIFESPTPQPTATPTETPAPTVTTTPTQTPTATPTPGAQLNVTVQTDKPSYINRETVYITVTATDGTDGSGIEDAAVHLVITTAKGREKTSDGATDADGVCILTYKVNSKRDGVGTYTAMATAAKEGYVSGSNSTQFDVME